MSATCRHCGERIVLTKFLGRDHWTHQPAGAAFMDGQHHFCRRTVATPSESMDQALAESPALPKETP